jgi:hypothetical protein
MTTVSTQHTQPIPDTRIYRAMKAGHLARAGHELTGHLDTRQGYAVLVRTCCPETGQPETCAKCGYPVMRSWGGYGHAPGFTGKRHIVTVA